ncbi:hypothetical protein DRP07_05125 [Archaeoglobales archaeon]|nr:MAG: hypothetical protein DRP07_05125 [Archaeoglobales archaeon]
MIEGVFCATVTPFKKDGVDRTSFLQLLEFLKGRIDGVLVCGTTGEFPSLSLDERELLIQTALEKQTENFKVIPHVGGTNLKEVKYLADFAKDCGATILAAVTPYYYKWDFESILLYYKEIEKTGLPLLIYEIPKYTGIILSLDDMEKLVNEVKIAAIKSTTDKNRLKELLKLKEVSLMVGTDSLIDFGLKIGYKGCISAIANFLPEAIKKIYSLVREGKLEKASELQMKINRVRSFLKEKGSIRSIKKALEIRNISGGDVRKPFINFTPEEGEEFLKELRKILEVERL